MLWTGYLIHEERYDIINNSNELNYDNKKYN